MNKHFWHLQWYLRNTTQTMAGRMLITVHIVGSIIKKKKKVPGKRSPHTMHSIS